MAREIDLTKKLSKEDVEWLNSRYPASYVERQIELAGGVKGQKSPETAPPAPETPSETPSGDSGTEDENGPEDGEEDLIGDTPAGFNPSDHGVDDVVKYLKTASDEEKSRVLAAEAADKGRSTILNA